ncbi:MAG: DUF4297 domain-containing protein [Bacillota bacterium]
MTEETEISKFDNGGAEAIKGFNFQKANLILLSVNNYQKNNFKIYIEAEDDIVVSYENYKAFIQVKKQVHTFKTITKKEMKKINDPSGKSKKKISVPSPSILEKNLSSGTEENTFKLIVKDVGQKDKKQLKIKRPGSICSELHVLNDTAKETLIKSLPDELVKKIENFYFFVSPVHEDLNEAEKYLIGCLTAAGVSVDDKRGRLIIAELSLTIDQKAQYVITNEVDKELKLMDKDYFSRILQTSESLNRFDNVLNSLDYNMIIKKHIKKEKLKIELNKIELKEDIKNAINEYIENQNDVLKISDKEIIEYVVNEFKSTKIEDITLIAVAIESLCELGDEL